MSLTFSSKEKSLSDIDWQNLMKRDLSSSKKTSYSCGLSLKSVETKEDNLSPKILK